MSAPPKLRCMFLARAVITAALAVAAGCSKPQPNEPLLALARADCDSRPEFTAALAVQVEDRGTSSVLDDKGRCLSAKGAAPTTYAVFTLPPGPTPYTLEILSRLVPRTIVRPVATLYDAAGQPLRTVPPDEFELNIAGLRAGLRSTGKERWLVVAADQTRLGQTLTLQLSALDGRVQTAATVYVPLIFIPPLVPDLVRQATATIALNGSVTVTAAPVRTVQYAAARPRQGPNAP